MTRALQAVHPVLMARDVEESARDRPAYRFLVRDVDALFAELRDRGALSQAAAAGGPRRQPGDTPWGTREFHLRDPGGNLLQFYAPLPAE